MKKFNDIISKIYLNLIKEQNENFGVDNASDASTEIEGQEYWTAEEIKDVLEAGFCEFPKFINFATRITYEKEEFADKIHEGSIDGLTYEWFLKPSWMQISDRFSLVSTPMTATNTNVQILDDGDTISFDYNTRMKGLGAKHIVFNGTFKVIFKNIKANFPKTNSIKNELFNAFNRTLIQRPSDVQVNVKIMPLKTMDFSLSGDLISESSTIYESCGGPARSVYDSHCGGSTDDEEYNARMKRVRQNQAKMRKENNENKKLHDALANTDVRLEKDTFATLNFVAYNSAVYNDIKIEFEEYVKDWVCAQIGL